MATPKDSPWSSTVRRVSAGQSAGLVIRKRVRDNHMIVDRLFAAAEVRLVGDNQKKVRIVRTDGRSQS